MNERRESSVPDSNKFKNYVAGHKLNELQGKEVVLVLGLMGHGKSEIINVLKGATYKYNRTEDK